MITLFMTAYETGQDVDVVLVLGALKSGLYSRDETTARLCVQLLGKTLQYLKKSNPDANFHYKFASWFTRIV